MSRVVDDQNRAASDEAAVVLLSGGLDSTTVLAIARDRGFRCYGLSIDYGQSHQSELTAAALIAARYGCIEHRVVRVDVGQFGGSALTDKEIAIPTEPTVGIPVTYVPARNTIMLAIALGWAEVLGATTIFVGVNAVDYSGYPDCRPEFIAAFNQLAALATKTGVEHEAVSILAPLQHASKADIIKMGTALGVDYSQTISCYQALEDGRACGQCDACRLRRQGFEDAGVPDPTSYIY